MHPGKFIAGCGVTVFAVVWIGGWTTGTLFFDYMIVSGAARQLESRNFNQTTGTILESEAVVEGESRKLKLSYSYRVKGKEYTGKDHTFGVSSIGMSDTRSIAARYQPGQQVTVYFNPSNPSSAVLQRGLSAEDVGSLLFMALFLTPFNLIMLVSWWAAYFTLFKPRRTDPPGGVTTWETSTAMYVRVKHTPARISALIALGAAAFVMIFVMAGAVALLKTTLVAFLGWLVVATAVLATHRWQQRKIDAGLYDVVVDGAKGEITIPPAGLKREAKTVPYGTLYGVTIEKDARSDSDGDDVSVYAPTLLYGDFQRARLFETRTEDEAKEFAEWFAKKLKTEFKALAV